MSTPPNPGPNRRGRYPNADRRGRERRVLYVGLLISVAFHVVLISVVSRWLHPEVRYVPVPRAAHTVEAEPGMRAVALSEVREEAAPSPGLPPLPPAEETREPPMPRPERDAAEPEPEAEPAARTGTRTAAERLAPRVVDPRLWRPMVVLPREPTLSDVQDRIEMVMEMLSDSALAEAERAVRARDWTVKDASGGRWGISPGGLHLGSITLPLPIYFPADMEQDARNAYWRELELQFDRAHFLDNFDARVRAIRERRERERAERRANPAG
jgi:hypothetical protein